MTRQDTLIWMLEDDQDDRSLTRNIIEKSGINASVTFFSNSNEMIFAMETCIRPSIILLDYNSRPLGGIDVLKKIKLNYQYNDIPVIILSEVADPVIVSECYRLGASSYITKPFTEKQAKQKIESFFSYWLSVAETELVK